MNPLIELAEAKCERLQKKPKGETQAAMKKRIGELEKLQSAIDKAKSDAEFVQCFNAIARQWKNPA